jgi:hypothetical protein
MEFGPYTEIVLEIFKARVVGSSTKLSRPPEVVQARVEEIMPIIAKAWNCISATNFELKMKVF